VLADMSTSTLAAIDIGGGLSSAWTSVANFVPKLVAFLIILLIGWIIARVLRAIVAAVLRKVGFDRLVERGGTKQMLERTNWDASELIARIVYYAILLIALEVAFGAFGPNPISNILTTIVGWLPKLIVAILIIIVVGAIARVVRDLIGRLLSGVSYGPMLGTIAAVFIWGLGIIAALNQVGIATAVTTPVLITVLATIGGVAVVGFGGGLIRPMQQRWETWIGRVEDQLPAAGAHNEAYQRGREDAMRSGSTARSVPPGSQEAGQAAGSAGDQGWPQTPPPGDTR
jgi:Conserved TM helix